MSHGESLIQTLAKMLKVHRELKQLSAEKTEILKKGDMNALNELLSKEQSHIAVITTLENEREQITATLLTERGVHINKPILADCLEFVTADERAKLQALQKALLDELAIIKDQNELNQQMIRQSLQFVNLSIDMLRPQPESPNYSRPDATGKSSEGSRSLFDSKA